LSENLKNIFLKNDPKIDSYRVINRGNNPEKDLYPKRDKYVHAQKLRSALQKCLDDNNNQKLNNSKKVKDGLYLEFLGAKNFELVTKWFDKKIQGIKLLNVRRDKDRKVTKATVYIPKGREEFFFKSLKKYESTVTNTGKPTNNDVFRSIENIKLALVESFWTEKKGNPPDEIDRYYEVWVFFDSSVNPINYKSYKRITKEIAHKNFLESCNICDIEIQGEVLEFPERLVYSVKANNIKLADLIISCDCISEFRLISEPNNFFYELTRTDQIDWIKELKDRINHKDSNSSICILDTGINYKHPLIDFAVQDENCVQSVNSNWSSSDDRGHGTAMAGIALYNDLNKCLSSDEPVDVNHSVESVKILPDQGENSENLYGNVTKSAVALAEIAAPNKDRVICMAVTAKDGNTEDGSPTSWSAAIDSIVSASDSDDSNFKRFFLVSAGNLDNKLLKDYPDCNYMYSIENPGQSWNALTIGAWTNNVQINDKDYKEYHPVADVGQLCPYSSTSQSWDVKKWPIKPEVLFDGGNAISNGYDFDSCADLSLLTTNNKIFEKPFSFINATSAATAQAAWMASKIFAEYPGIWPETVRALIVHSAEWTKEMKIQVCKKENHFSKGELGNLLRTCVPNLKKALQCTKNSVNMIIQNIITPYNSSEGKNEIQFYELPWPKEELMNLSDIKAKLKITLSYYIEPGPGELGWNNKYRYQSCGLRFEVVNAGETREHFSERINGYERAKNEDYDRINNKDWYLGAHNRNLGSIHSDSYEDIAANLSTVNYIAIFPVSGWWKTRENLGKKNNKLRYSLVATIETPSLETDLYTPIVNKIKIPITTSIEY